ncbi:hypothetical protein [Algoriphagus limi]|uniref:N-acetyltransferase domain-containing protein n=1 Tax=Algoriphagus limi TaxID=2975273 RepID=A0ABT2G142_9BACT|nr:hypothetical protein [Algoriphagus limi]MCS5488987.1 hypothetical protein [Algoriphagus limi]
MEQIEVAVEGNTLEKKEDEFRIEIKGKLIHRSRVFHKSHLLTSFHFPKPFLVIGDCLTDPNYRGMGIYPRTIQYIATTYRLQKQIFILVSKDNISSIKGIEKAGFQFLVRLKGFRFLGFYLKKEILCTKND